MCNREVALLAPLWIWCSRNAHHQYKLSTDVQSMLVLAEQGLTTGTHRSRYAPCSRLSRRDTLGSVAIPTLTQRSLGCSARSGSRPAATWRSPVGSAAAWCRTRPCCSRPRRPPAELYHTAPQSLHAWIAPCLRACDWPAPQRAPQSARWYAEISACSEGSSQCSSALCSICSMNWRA